MTCQGHCDRDETGQCRHGCDNRDMRAAVLGAIEKRWAQGYASSSDTPEDLADAIMAGIAPILALAKGEIELLKRRIRIHRQYERRTRS